VIGAIGLVTFRGLIARRRSILMLLLAAVPVGVALLARLRGLPGDPVERTIDTVELLIVRTVLPLVALVFGTTVLGAELEDGTAVHLLTKPVARWRIIAAKTLAAAPSAMVLMVCATLATGLLIGGERGAAPVTVALSVGVAIGSLLYVMVFVALSVLTSRALIVGLVYVVLWEGVLAGLFEGTQVFSIREYVMALAGALEPDGTVAAAAPLATTTAVVASMAVFVGAFAIATWRLERIELTGGD
jgi:ABC-2 type transport system permease protein